MSKIQKPGFLSPYENPLSISTAENPLSIPAAENPLSIPATENPLSILSAKIHYPFQLRQSSHPFHRNILPRFHSSPPSAGFPKIRFAIIEFMKKTPNYILTEIYYDFGISGYKETRPGFCKMMEDARKGCFGRLLPNPSPVLHAKYRYCAENHPAVEGTGD